MILIGFLFISFSIGESFANVFRVANNNGNNYGNGNKHEESTIDSEDVTCLFNGKQTTKNKQNGYFLVFILFFTQFYV